MNSDFFFNDGGFKLEILAKILNLSSINKSKMRKKTFLTIITHHNFRLQNILESILIAN